MIGKKIISPIQYIWIIFSIITSFTVLQIPGLLIFHSGREAWLAVILAWGMDAMLAITYAYMGIRFPGESFVQYSETILGKYFGKIAGIIFPLFFLLVAILLMRSLSDMMVTMFLPETPIEVILGTAYLVIAYGLRKGIEVMSRTNQILSPLYLISFFIIFILVLPNVNIERLKPELTEGFYPVLTGAVFLLTFFAVCSIMGMIIPICNRQDYAFMGKFVGLSLATIVVCPLVIFSIGTFGVEQAGNMINTGLQLVRFIRLANIIERVEIIWMLIAVAAGIITATNSIWAFCLGVAQSVKLSSYKPLVYPTVLIAYILSVTSFDSYVELLNFIYYTFPIIGVAVEAILENFLFIMALILKKRGKAA